MTARQYIVTVALILTGYTAVVFATLMRRRCPLGAFSMKHRFTCRRIASCIVTTVALILLAGTPTAAADLPDSPAPRAVHVVPRSDTAPSQKSLPLPEAALDTRFRFVLQNGHTDALQDLIIDPTGKYLISYGQYGAIKVWDLATGTVLRDYFHGRRETGCRLLALDARGNRIATGANDGRVNLWAFSEDRLIRSIDTGQGFISGVAFTPDGKMLVSRPGRPIERWDIDTGEKIDGFGKSFFNQRYAVNQNFVVTPDGRFLVAAGGDVLSRHDVATGQALKGYRLPSGTVRAVAVIPGTDTFAAGGSDGVITIFHTLTGEVVRRLTAEHKEIRSLCADPSGKVLVAGGDGDISFWQVADGSLIRVLKRVHVAVTSLAVDPEGTLLVSGGTAGEIKLWDFKTGTAIRTLLPLMVHHGDMVDAIRRMDVDAGFGFLVTETGDRALSVWDLNALKLVRFADLPSSLFTFGISPACRYVGVTRPGDILDVWDAATGNRVRRFSGEHPYANVKGFVFDPAGRMVVTEHDAGGGHQQTAHPSVTIWSMENGKRLAVIADARSVHMDPKGRFIAGQTPEGAVRVWDLPSGSLRHDFPGTGGDPAPIASGGPGGPLRPSGRKVPTGVWQTIMGPDGDILLALRLTGRMDILNIAEGTTLATVALEPTRIYKTDMARVRFDPSGRYIFYATVNKGWGRIWEARTGRQVLAPEGHRSTINTFLVSPDGKRALTAAHSDIILWDLNTGVPLRSFKDKLMVTACVVDSDWQRMAVQSGRRIEIWDLSTGVKINTWNATGRLLALNRGGASGSPLRGAVYTEDPSGKTAGAMWDPFTGKPMAMAGLRYSEPRFMVRGDFVLTVDRAIQVRLANVATGHVVNLTNAGPEWVVTAPDGYFDASKHGGALVAMVRGLEAYGVDQFAVRNNRPDILLTRMGLGGGGRVAHFAQQYRRRLKKLGFSDSELTSALEVPLAEITSARRQGRQATITCVFSDAHYPLKDYQVFINGVALFGRQAKPLRGKRQQVNETVSLSAGTNVIEVSCTNAGGAASFRAMTEVAGPAAVKGDLYMLGLGVSRYRDAALNLGYAAKDAVDLAGLFARMEGAFGKIFVKTLVDDAVTPAAVDAARHFLAQAGVDDTIVVFVAGHGVVDPEDGRTYYYLTYDTDLKRLEDTALSYDALEALLDGAAARKRLMLMDTCESGEVEDDQQESFMTAAAAKGFQPRTTRAVIVVQRDRRRRRGAAPADLDRYIYNDLLRRAGATVLSSSRGDEFSYESARFENGFFTEALMTALTSSDADRNGDLYLSGEELEHYVAGRVAEMSGDLQHPTVDRDNIHQEIRLPMLRVSAADTAGERDIPMAHLHWYLGEPVAVFTNARQPITGNLKSVNPQNVLLDRSARGETDIQIPIDIIRRIEKR